MQSFAVPGLTSTRRTGRMSHRLLGGQDGGAGAEPVEAAQAEQSESDERGCGEEGEEEAPGHMQSYEGLRPGLTCHIEGTRRVGDHVEYVLYVCDTQSGAEWRTTRRFREFNRFHDLILEIRPSLAWFDFPRKRINVAEAADDMVDERVLLLQKFLRKISSIISVNYNHHTTPKVHLALQNFLGVDEKRLCKFYAMDRAMRKKRRFHIVRMIETFVQSVLCLHIMDRVVSSFVDHFNAASTADQQVAPASRRIPRV